MKLLNPPHSEEIVKEVTRMKGLSTYNRPFADHPKVEVKEVSFIDSLTAEDRLKYHLDVPINKLSGGGCTSDGILIETAGMEREDLMEWVLANKVTRKKKRTL